MALSTKDLQEGGSSAKKTISPGNHTLKINSVNLEKFKFKEGGYHLILNLETEPLKDFEGFLLDKDDSSKGFYKGQVGKVKANRYAYADGETKSGIKVDRDRSILMFIKNLCKSLSLADGGEHYSEWFTDQDGKHETIEDFVEAFSTHITSNEKVYLDFCVGGREYENKNGYINYDMYLPKTSNGKFAFGNNVMSFDESNPQHLIKLVVKNVESFGNSDNDISIPTNTSTDFSLD